MRPRVLIPSDNFDLVANFAAGYREVGYDVVGGSLNFHLDSADYEIVHLLWPEEFTGWWTAPTSTQIDAVVRRLDKWARHSHLIISVNNLYPHGFVGDSSFHQLYTSFYERAEVIHHFSQTSKDWVCREYSSIVGRNHVVRVGFNYERLLPFSPRDRVSARYSFNLAPDEMVFLSLGTLRFWEEVQLLRRAFELAEVPKKRLVVMANYFDTGPRLRQLWRRWHWQRWTSSPGVRPIFHRIPDEELPTLVKASDAVVVVRQNSMSSGVPSLAMTFGRFIIAPNFGGMAEYLADTGNALYEQTSAEDLARAMELAGTVDRERIGAENACLAAGWGWAGIVRSCLDALAGGPMLAPATSNSSR